MESSFQLQKAIHQVRESRAPEEEQAGAGAGWLAGSFAEKVLEVLVEKLHVSQQHVLAEKEAKRSSEVGKIG